jgi:glycosyltransferase involved in cell wall biosynthesis
VFLTVFGYYSSVARKNPVGAIEAFRRAFPTGSGVSLVVKCIDEEAHPADHAAVAVAAAEHPDVHLLPGYISRAEMDALVQCSDAVVSLHRAEGFGFTPAEAMAQGRPVVATRYSGNLDYMSDDNSMLVACRMVRIGSHGGPYPADGLWAEPDLDAAASAMRRLVSEPGLAGRLGRKAATDMAAYSPGAAGKLMCEALLPYADEHRWARARLRAARLRAFRRF